MDVLCAEPMQKFTQVARYMRMLKCRITACQLSSSSVLHYAKGIRLFICPHSKIILRPLRFPNTTSTANIEYETVADVLQLYVQNNLGFNAKWAT